MKKLFIYFAIIIISLITLSSCTKEEAYWKVETSTIEYYDYSDFTRFASEIQALDDEITWTVSQVEREVEDIVNKYDGDLGGTVYLKTGPSYSGPWTIKEIWTMRLR